MTFKLLLQMVFGVFSWKRSNMRWFNLKRLLIVLFLFPIFMYLLVVNNVFLLLDYVFFPHFLWLKVKRPVFIIAAPRSATTYLYHALAKGEGFTCFKLWEIVFAPSILQKYMAVGVLKFDKLIGSPIRKIVRFKEGILVGKLRQIHLIGLEYPEEDEAVLLWSLSSFYLNFFYPDSTFFDDLVVFDDGVSSRRKARIMRGYKRYVLRHNFVFNYKSEKRYLSKNPLFMPKVGAIGELYPDAVVLNINRCPAKTFPSTLGLNETLYRIFTSRPVPQAMNEKTYEILIQWYQMAERNLHAYFPDRHLKIDFIKLVTQDAGEIQLISDFLGSPPALLQAEKKKMNKKHTSANQYQAMTDVELAAVLDQIPFMRPYCG